MGQKGALLGHVTYFTNFGTPWYMRNGWKYKTPILQADWG